MLVYYHYLANEYSRSVVNPHSIACFSMTTCLLFKKALDLLASKFEERVIKIGEEKLARNSQLVTLLEYFAIKPIIISHSHRRWLTR